MTFLRVDAVVVRVPTVDEGLAFYRDSLGHELIWRRPDAAGLRMRDSRSELVLMTMIDAETDLLVENIDDAIQSITHAGGTVTTPPIDIDVGRAARIRDPFGNSLTLVELSKGRYATDPDGTVQGVTPGPFRSPGRP
jgi:catechol 2,3-dioxygenase-like lactoylglutathione lyase family enzyme